MDVEEGRMEQREMGINVEELDKGGRRETQGRGKIHTDITIATAVPSRRL